MNKMYVAPLEGITGYIFRNVLNDMFGEGIDKFFTPFLMPHVKKPMSSKDINEIDPKHNVSNLAVQILTSDAEGFSFLEKAVREYGYSEINLNLGCPSNTVCNKGRGSGFLVYPEKLDRFLDAIYSSAGGDISIKTRLGYLESDEFVRILEIYNKYPVSELTIHPRVKKQMYTGEIDFDMFAYAMRNAKAPLCYNGDITSVADYNALIAKMRGEYERGKCQNPDDISIMIGRGIIGNPGLIRQITTNRVVTGEELASFMKRLRLEYSAVFSGDVPVLFKMKEVWVHMKNLYPNAVALTDKILKAKSMSEYLVLESKIYKESAPKC